MPYIKAESGINWFYKIKGEGKALVFIHGWSFDSGVWFRQIDNFSGHKVITLDLPGHGNSDYKAAIDIVKDLYFIFKELGLNKINLVGHSLGGFIGLKFTLTYPVFIDKIILIGTNAKFVRSCQYQYGLSEDEVNKLRGLVSGSYPDILLVFMRWLFTNEERRQGNFREAWDSMADRKKWPQKEALIESLSIIEKEDLKNRLKEIDLPTLIISGTADPICPVESTGYLHSQIKYSQIELFKDCGHLPFLTQDERFNELAHSFLN